MVADLPPIPVEAYKAGGAAINADWRFQRGMYPESVALTAFVAAWPHLYAAALRHAAEHVLENDDACSDLLRAAADEAERLRAQARRGR